MIMSMQKNPLMLTFTTVTVIQYFLHYFNENNVHKMFKSSLKIGLCIIIIFTCIF